MGVMGVGGRYVAPGLIEYARPFRKLNALLFCSCGLAFTWLGCEQKHGLSQIRALNQASKHKTNPILIAVESFRDAHVVGAATIAQATICGAALGGALLHTGAFKVLLERTWEHGSLC